MNKIGVNETTCEEPVILVAVADGRRPENEIIKYLVIGERDN
jgi:hypothetical protein